MLQGFRAAGAETNVLPQARPFATLGQRHESSDVFPFFLFNLLTIQS